MPVKPLRAFINSPTGRHVRLVVRLLRVLTKRWRTVRELHEDLGVDKGTLRNWTSLMADLRALRVRNRPHEMQEDGNKTTGPRPREYKVATNWSDLST